MRRRGARRSSLRRRCVSPLVHSLSFARERHEQTTARRATHEPRRARSASGDGERLAGTAPGEPEASCSIICTRAMSSALVGSTRRAVGLVALLRRALVHCRGDVALGLLTPFGRRFLHAALQADRCALSRDPSHRYEVRTLSHAAKTQTRSRKIAFPARYFCGRCTRPAAFREPSDARRTAPGKKAKENRPWAKNRRTATRVENASTLHARRGR